MLHYACSCGNYQIFEYVLDHMLNIHVALFDTDNPTKETPLHWAVLKNNHRVVQQLSIEYQAIMHDQLQDNTSLGSVNLKNILDLENVN